MKHLGLFENFKTYFPIQIPPGKEQSIELIMKYGPKTWWIWDSQTSDPKVIREFFSKDCDGSYRLKNKLKNTLLYFGGDDVKLGLDTDEELGRMLNDGVLFHVDVVNLRGRFGQCHRNVADKYKRFSSGGFKIVTGYALANGIWFQHSWGLGSRGKIMETTGNKYDMYYGYVLNGEESHEFCFSNY